MRLLQTQPKLQLLRLLGRIAGGQNLEAEVACGSWCARRLVLGNLAEGHVGKDPEMFHTAEFDGWFRLLCRVSRPQINKTFFRASQRTVPIRRLAPSGFYLQGASRIPKTPHHVSSCSRTIQMLEPKRSNPIKPTLIRASSLTPCCIFG